MYEFESTDFGLSQEGVHLLRSGHNYTTIIYHDINSAVIKKDYEIKNVWLTLSFGIALVTFAVLQTINVVGLFNNPKIHTIYIESIILPVLPGIVGCYLLYISMKKGSMLLIQTDSKKYKLRLRELHKKEKDAEVIAYLKQKLTYKLSIQKTA